MVTIKNVAVMMIFWLFCQQAGAALTAVLTFHSGDAVHKECLDQDAGLLNKNIVDASGAHDHVAGSTKAISSPSSDLMCCEVYCHCCISGCVSMLSSQYDRTALLVSFQLNSLYVFVVSHAPVQSLFRPPIVIA